MKNKPPNFMDTVLDGLEEKEAAAKTDKKKRTRPAEVNDYRELFFQYFGRIKRDIFSGSLMYYDKTEGLWLPCANCEDSLRAVARQESIATDTVFEGPGIKENLALLEIETPKELIVKIPAWDEEDRLAFLAKKVRLNDDQLISPETFEEIVKTWCANLFRKLKDPSMNESPAREFVLILSSKQQEIGKDYWIRTLLSGLGQWFSSFHVSNDTTDLYMQLHEGLALYLGEFDRTSRVESALLKDLITADHSKVRAKYDRKSAYRRSRASFIASCNGNDVFRDHTGNSRYALFEIDSIDRDYKKTEGFSLQCMAQARWLADHGYTASEKAWRELKRSRNELTPDDPNLNIVDIWNMLANRFLEQLSLTNYDEYSRIYETGMISNTMNAAIISEVAKIAGVSPRQVRNAFASQRLLHRKMHERYVRIEIRGKMTGDDTNDTLF